LIKANFAHSIFLKIKGMADSYYTNEGMIRVAIVEDDKAIREGLEILLRGTPGFDCPSACSSGEEALEILPALNPDVILMDIKLPGIDGIECIVKLKALSLPANIIMLTIFEDADAIFKSLSAGASGYLIKQTPPAKILEAIREVYLGGSPMSAEVARKVVQSFQQKETMDTSVSLTKREEEILSYVVKGYYYKEIAEACFSSALKP
jgi:DNA-binding NarL/FixJ family response regulator